MNIILIYFAIKYKGDWDAIYKALEEKEKVSLPELNNLEKKIKEEKWNIITILDIDYPNKLKEAYKPPFVIWCQGDKEIIKEKLLCVSGNQVDALAKARVKNFCPEITKCNGIVNASYKGMDQEILKATENAKRVIILGNGIDKPYINHKIAKKELLITEYPPTTKPSKERFRNRNRLVSAFADSLILFTSEKDGPINNLVTNFLNLGKEIYCFPGDGSEKDGNSELIKQGANLITKIKDMSN